MYQHMKRYFALLLALIMVWALPALALCEADVPAGEPLDFGEPTISSVTLTADHGQVIYPVVSGLTDEEYQSRINTLIFDRGKIGLRLSTLNTLGQDGWGLDVTYDHTLSDGILSLRISAKGQMENGRQGQEYATVNLDMKNQREITLEDIFADVEGAFAYMASVLEAEIAPTLSGHTENDGLLPIPRDLFSFTHDSILFHYPSSQLSMLSGYSGAFSFYYYELAPYLNLSPGSVLDRLSILPMEIGEETPAKVAALAAEGMLPGVPVSLGEGMPEVIGAYRQLADPDYYPGGRYFQLEDPAFRSIWIMTDAITTDYTHSTVNGIWAFRMNLWGIIIGETTMDAWRSALGQPESTVVLDEETAYSYWLVAGTSDYYTFGSYKLRLHADGDGVLYCMQLLK